MAQGDARCTTGCTRCSPARRTVMRDNVASAGEPHHAAWPIFLAIVIGLGGLALAWLLVPRAQRAAAHGGRGAGVHGRAAEGAVQQVVRGRARTTAVVVRPVNRALAGAVGLRPDHSTARWTSSAAWRRRWGCGSGRAQTGLREHVRLRADRGRAGGAGQLRGLLTIATTQWRASTRATAILTLLIVLPLLGALAAYLSGERNAKHVALWVGIAEFVISLPAVRLLRPGRPAARMARRAAPRCPCRTA